MTEGSPGLVASLDTAPGDTAYLAHGTFTPANTVIERNGAALGLPVTRGSGGSGVLRTRE